MISMSYSRVIDAVLAENFLANQIEIGIARIAGEQLAAQFVERIVTRLTDQIGAQSFFGLHEQHVIGTVGGGARDHRVGAAERKIPAPFGHASVVVRRVGGLVKPNFEIFLAKNPLYSRRPNAAACGCNR